MIFIRIILKKHPPPYYWKLYYINNFNDFPKITDKLLKI
jgi:hypothetical protein